MKKVMFLTLLTALCAPLFAADTVPCACKKGEPCGCKAPQMAGMKPGPCQDKACAARKDEFKKARKEHKAKMRATEEKAEKLVAEYNKLKPGKKKEAKKAEIAAFVASIREEQLKFKTEQLARFQERLQHMQAGLAREQSPEAKQAWVDRKTEALIAEDGDMDALFGEPEMKPRKMEHGPAMPGAAAPEAGLPPALEGPELAD